MINNYEGLSAQPSTLHLDSVLCSCAASGDFALLHLFVLALCIEKVFSLRTNYVHGIHFISHFLCRFIFAQSFASQS